MGVWQELYYDCYEPAPPGVVTALMSLDEARIVKRFIEEPPWDKPKGVLQNDA